MSFSGASMAADEPPADRGEPHPPSIQSLLDGLALTDRGHPAFFNQIGESAQWSGDLIPCRISTSSH